MEHIAVALVHPFTSTDHITQPVLVCRRGQVATQQPARAPIRSAHVTGEKGQVKTKAGFGGDICNLDQVRQFVGGHHVRFGLEIIPQQKDADDVHADAFDDGKLFAHFAGIKVTPPIHGFFAWPVVYTEGEICHEGLSCEMNCPLRVGSLIYCVD